MRLDLAPVGRLPVTMESTLYFTAAEALTNVAKHSAGKHAVSSLTRTANAVHLRYATMARSAPIPTTSAA